MLNLQQRINSTCPYGIDQQHWDEWVASGVSPEIIEANVRSYSGQTALEIVTEAATVGFGGGTAR